MATAAPDIAGRTGDEPLHGGDLDLATRLHGEPVGGWLDLSTGINPHAYPTGAIDPRALSRLPAAGALERLTAAARSAYAIAAEAALVAVPGTELALRLLPAILPGDGPVAVIAPGYATHGDAFASFRQPVATIAGLADLPADARTVILGNPNNPDGRRLPVDELIRLAATLHDRQGILIVDEAFADVAPEIGLAPHLHEARAIILRSFGKFFGLPGLRLGFVAGPPDLLEPFARHLGAWPVSTTAIEIGTRALTDAAWRKAMRERLAAEAEQMRALLSMHGLNVAGATDLFVLVRHAKAHDLHRFLARQGIWTRIFAYDQTSLRLGLAPPGPALTRLDAALAASFRAL